MSHEVYNYGEGYASLTFLFILSVVSSNSLIDDSLSLLACSLIGKVAADNSHKWVFNDTPNVNDPSFTSSWNVSLDLVSLSKKSFRSPLLHIASENFTNNLFHVMFLLFLTTNIFLYSSQQPRAWDLQFNTGIQVSRLAISNLPKLD